MATVNLGRIKPVFRGAYNNSTSYVVDDIVTSGNETFIAIQAGSGNATSNASYWTKLAAKGADGSNGTNGTDVGTVITTQGDILYRDGSGLQRLPKGTAGQIIQMNSGATAPEYGAAPSGKVKSITTSVDVGQRSTTSTSYTDASNSLALTITPESASSKFLVSFDFSGGGDGTSARYYFSIQRSTGGTDTNIGQGNMVRSHEVSNASMTENPMTINVTDSPNTTAQVVYHLIMKVQNGTGYINTNGKALGIAIEYI